MARTEIELNPVSHLTLDAIGKPGQRTFYIQGRTEDQTITILIEKVQAQTMAIGIEQFLGEVAGRFPDLPAPTADYAEEEMRIQPPVDPLFRAGDLALAYDTDTDRMVLVVREAQMEGQDPEKTGVVRFWCTRSQMLALSHWALDVASRGRPACPYCGEPMDDDHICPKKNGHKH